MTTPNLSREQVAAILTKLAECIANDHLAAARYFRGQGNGLFHAACLIREVMRGELEMCEHGVEDGEYCSPCNLEYKRAAACDGQE